MTFTELLEFSYTPYSGKPNACIAIGKSGKAYPGVRIENISYPLTISAIQAALFTCIAAGDTPVKLIVQKAPKRADLLNFWKNEYQLEIETAPGFVYEPINPIIKIPENKVSEKLFELCGSAVTPNSGFPVSCLLQVEGGFIPGVNVECSNWELGLCAERIAIALAISHGIRDFSAVHVYAPKSDYVSPCGGCRQVLMEHLPGKSVLLYQNETEQMRLTTSHLLPYHFKAKLG